MNNSFKRILGSFGAVLLGFFAAYFLSAFLAYTVSYFSGTWFVPIVIVLGVLAVVGLGIMAIQMQKRGSVWFWFFVFAIVGMLIGGYFSIRLIPAIQAF